jgi:hypothetical protein
MKSTSQVIKYLIILMPIFLIIGIISCTKATTNQVTSNPADQEFGCTATTSLVTLTNTSGTLAYNIGQAEWQIVINNPLSSRAYSCSFCDKSILDPIVAGKPLSSTFNVTVDGNVKRRYANQEPITATSGGYEWYVLSATSVK